MTFTDCTSDRNGSEIYEISQRIELPEFVKRADHTAILETATHRALFADQVNKLFPCDSPERTWLNYAFYQNQKSAMTQQYRENLEAAFEKFAEYWEIDLAGLKTVYNPEKVAEEEIEGYPLRNEHEVKIAAEWFFDNAYAMPVTERADLAREIYEKAAEGEHKEFARKQAGYGFGVHRDVLNGLLSRDEVLENNDDRFAWYKFAKEIADKVTDPATRPDDFVKYAEIIEEADEMIGFKEKYASGLSPLDIICKNDFHKIATMAARRCTLVTGTQYDSDDFGKIASEDLKALFGPDFVRDASDALGQIDTEKLAELVATLPRPDAESFDELVSGKIHKYAEAKPEKIDWNKHAQAYAGVK